MSKAHKNRSKSFNELSDKEQASAININKANTRRMEKARERRKRESGK